MGAVKRAGAVAGFAVVGAALWWRRHPSGLRFEQRRGSPLGYFAGFGRA